MRAEDRLQQRELDRVLPRDESAALAALTASRPDIAHQAAALQALDADLRAMAKPLRTADHDLDLRQRIMARVAQRQPAAQVRVRPLDLVYAASAAVLVFAAYGLTGAAVRTLFEQAVVMTWAIGLSLVLGMLLLAVPSLLRNAESSLLGALLRRPVTVGPADVLVYRAVGAALVVGAVWLTH